ncbi:MAG: hypothetical protein R3E68_00915 [Burkholderiaceae bacterium]
MTAWVPVLHGASGGRADEQDTLTAAQAIRDALVRLGYSSDVIGTDRHLAAVPVIRARGPAAVFNLIEALDGDGRLGVLGCEALQAAGLRYTGSPRAAYLQSSSKLLTKQLFVGARLPTPAYWTRSAPAGQRVIIKSVWEHASFGIDQASVVAAEDAAEQIRERQARFGGQFFAEAYVPGREFNVALLEQPGGPRVLPIAEMSFDALPAHLLPIVDYQAKWDESSDGYRLMDRRFGLETREPELAARIAALTRRCWHAARLRGYARVDLRLDAAGGLQLLEFNANPCLAPDAGFVAAGAQAGIGFDSIIGAIVNAALQDCPDSCSASVP